MSDSLNPKSTAQIAGHPIHPMLVPFPIAFFTATLVCDVVYRQNADMFWFTASQYLLGAGIVMALVAALAGFTDFFGEPRIRALAIAWWHMLGNLTLVIIEAFNWYRRDDLGAQAILPTGLLLSLAGVLVMLGTGWLGWEMVYRKRVAIAEQAAEAESAGRHAPMHAAR